MSHGIILESYENGFLTIRKKSLALKKDELRLAAIKFYYIHLKQPSHFSLRRFSQFYFVELKLKTRFQCPEQKILVKTMSKKQNFT